jgi:segregation and condensation protein B
MNERDDQERPEQKAGADPEAAEAGVDILALLEAMLFASPEPLSLDEVAGALPGLERATLEHCLDRLERALCTPGRGLRLERVAGGYRLVTDPGLAEPLRALFRFRNQRRLTPATLDVLAIVAYAQPITAPEIHEIRGADPQYALKVLLDRKLARVVGRKRVVGRPLLYGTTRDFLLHFGLDSLEDLPPVEGYGSQVVPAQGRLFPVTADGEVEYEEIDEEPPGGTGEEEGSDATEPPEASPGAAKDDDLDEPESNPQSRAAER